MFKGYTSKTTPTPAAPSPFAADEIPSDWAGSSPAAPAAAAASSWGAAEPAPSESAAAFDAAAAAPAVTRNVLNSDVSVVGILRFTDDLLVDGSVEGEITSDGVLTVGSNASIQAGDKNKVAIRTKSAIIHGKVVGDIHVTDRVELAGTAELVGDVVAARIAIQEGAIFVGNCRVGNPSTTVAAPTPKRGSKAASAAKVDNLLG